MLVFRCDGCCRNEHRQVTKLGASGVHSLFIPPHWQVRYHTVEKRDYFACSDNCARKILKTNFDGKPAVKEPVRG